MKKNFKDLNFHFVFLLKNKVLQNQKIENQSEQWLYFIFWEYWYEIRIDRGGGLKTFESMSAVVSSTTTPSQTRHFRATPDWYSRENPGDCTVFGDQLARGSELL